MCIDFLFFFFNYLATTGFYTYAHPLSLHDALPISPLGRQRIGFEPAPFALFAHAIGQFQYLQEKRVVRGHGERHVQFAVPGSEEHTSELQSLMRISYAVFCLKKKKLAVEHET